MEKSLVFFKLSEYFMFFYTWKESFEQWCETLLKHHYAERTFLPLALLAWRTFLPPFVLVLLRKPCTFDLCLFFGWNVIFICQTPPSLPDLYLSWVSIIPPFFEKTSLQLYSEALSQSRRKFPVNCSKTEENLSTKSSPDGGNPVDNHVDNCHF